MKGIALKAMSLSDTSYLTLGEKFLIWKMITQIIIFSQDFIKQLSFPGLRLLETIFAHWDHAFIHKENTSAIRNAVKTESIEGGISKMIQKSTRMKENGRLGTGSPSELLTFSVVKIAQFGKWTACYQQALKNKPTLMFQS